MKQERIVSQIDKMVASGRITEQEAVRLRATEGTADFDAAVAGIRARHAAVHMEGAIGAGQMSQEEAASYLDRLRNGEHPKGLRAQLAMHRQRK